MSQLLVSLIVLCVTTLQSSAEYNQRLETCSGFSLNVAKLPRFYPRQYDGRFFQSVMALDRRTVDLPQEPKLSFVMKGDVFELSEAGKVRGTQTCAVVSFESEGKMNQIDPCHFVNVTKPEPLVFGDSLFIPIDRNTLIITFCAKKENGICTEGLICVSTQERRPSAKRLAYITRYLRRIGLLDEFGVTELPILDPSLNDCEFPPPIKRLADYSDRRSNKPRKHYRY